ncbi:MAG: magnesium transporter CorA family protein, partial [Roseiflexus sp.]
KAKVNRLPVVDKDKNVVGAQIFDHFRPESLQEIFALKRELLLMRKIVASERDVLNVLIRREAPVYPRDMVAYFQDVYDHLIRMTDSIDTYRDLLSSALDAFLSLQSNQLNEVVKTLTIASIILMSAALIAGVYGMNFEFMPELSWPWGYPFALGLMAAISLLLIAIFKRRGWL